MRTSLGMDMAASPRRVFELASDLASWPRLLPHYRRVHLRMGADGRTLAGMVAVRQVGPLPLPVTWRALQWADDSDPEDLRLHFEHVRGVTRGMRVTWHIRPTPGGARVTIEHDFERAVPLLGPDVFPALIDRLFVKPIAGRTLATFRSLAEHGG